jgi:hypothetical protein
LLAMDQSARRSLLTSLTAIGNRRDQMTSNRLVPLPSCAGENARLTFKQDHKVLSARNDGSVLFSCV